jgi:hypothetical protein
MHSRSAESVIASLSEEGDFEHTWRNEIRRRVAALDAGTASTRLVADVLRELRGSGRP